MACVNGDYSCLISRKVVDSPVTMTVASVLPLLQERARGKREDCVNFVVHTNKTLSL